MPVTATLQGVAARAGPARRERDGLVSLAGQPAAHGRAILRQGAG